MASKTQHWVRIFEVNETKRHPKGYTIYQVKSTVFPRSSPEASTSVVVWRRYSEIRRLHRAISELHEKLHLSGQVPPFPRATILNRFEAEVVEARRQATLSLLRFIGQHNSLFTSEPFTNFFQNDERKSGEHLKEKRKGSTGRSKEAEHLATTLGIQESASLYSQLSESDDELSLCSNQDHPCLPIPASVSPGFPEPGESIASASVCGPNNSSSALPVSRMKNGAVESPGISEESRQKIFSKNLHESHHALQRTTEGQIVKEKVKNSQNIEPYSYSSAEDSVFEFPQSNPNTHIVDKADFSEKHILNSSVSSSSSLSYCIYENPVHDSPSHHEPHPMKPQPYEEPASPIFHPLSSLDTTKQVRIPERKSSVPLTPLTPLTTTVTPDVPTHKVPSPQEVASSQYIFIAAQQISEAQQHEKQKDYKKALNMYREGVGTLLQGVQAGTAVDHTRKQGDNDGSRRDAVKRKTAQYLQRAEQLVARLTRKDKKRDQFLEGPTAEISHDGEGELKCRASDLQRYRVAGSTGSVVIATDTSTEDTVAIKVLMKSGSGTGEKTVVPRGVPFMVPVIRYHETDTAIYLVLKFISGGKLWSHIKKYVEIEGRIYDNLHDTITSSTYSGRRLLLESLDCDRSSTEHHTPSHSSHASHLSTSSLLNIPSCITTETNSEGPDISSSCLPEGYLQIYSEYGPSFLPSSSMLVLPHAQNTQEVMDSVPKSLSTGALSGTTGYPEPCCAGHHDTRESLAESHVTKDIIFPHHNGDNAAEEDRVSIGSDTLSGVSEDFSCSLPVGVPDLLPDTVPLPEVRVTMNNSVNSLCDNLAHPVEGKINYSDNIDGCDNVESSILIKIAYAENGKEMPDCKQEKSPLTLNGGKDSTMPHKTMDHLDLEEDNSITDTSFASTTLPSFSWTKQEDSEVASLDIEDLIRNSRQLLQNVDNTLLQSRSQSIVLPDSGDNSSADHSELPYDGDSVNQDLLDKGESLANQNSFEKKALAINLSKNNAPVRLSPLMARRLGLDREGNRITKSRLKSAKSEGNLSSQKRPDVPTAVRKIADDPDNGNVKQAELLPSAVSLAALPNLEHTKDLTKKICSSQRKNPSPIKCDPPESSLASLLEKHSVNRGQESHRRLPEGIVKVWLSQVISAVSYLHQQGIIWGDLNPDNILLDEGGSILMTYESRWSSVQQGVWRSQGLTSKTKRWMKKGYLAPELTSPLAHPTPASDWWSVGALMYHLLTGQSISQAHPSGITSHTELLMPEHLSPEAVSLLSQLLCVHPTERLGGGGAGVQEVKDHTFFTGIQWVC